MNIPTCGARRLKDGVIVVIVIAIAALIGVARSAAVNHTEETVVMPIAKAFPYEVGDSTRLRAFVVLDSADCSSNLGFLELFQRDTIHVRLSRLYLKGPRSGLASTATLLREKGINTPLLEETRAVERARLDLGSIDTPFLIVLDADGVVRLAMTSPPDIDTYVKFPQLLKSLWEQGVSDPLKIR
ncbi:MAG: hypothetical protein ABJE10_11075 [bacterium]